MSTHEAELINENLQYYRDLKAQATADIVDLARQISESGDVALEWLLMDLKKRVNLITLSNDKIDELEIIING